MNWIIPLIAALAGGVVLAIVVLSLQEIKNRARSWWGCCTIVIVDPATDAELQRIAESKGSKRHKRFVYNKTTGARKLVESNSIAPELAHRSRVEAYVT